MPVVDFAKATQLFQRHLVADMTAERITGIRGVANDAALTQDPRGLCDQSGLRMRRVNAEVLGHGVGNL